MTDKISLSEDKYLNEFGAAFRLGEKIMEMADRVLVAHRCVPGTKAVWPFEMDDVRFEVTITVAEPKDG